jgi:hypothetical protein
MNPMHRIAVVNEDLFNEVAHTNLSLETVFFLYGAIVVVAAMLWALGVFVFGGSRSIEPRSSDNPSPSRDRITPAVL